MAKIFSKIGEMFFGDEEEFEEGEDFLEPTPYRSEPALVRKGNKVVNINATTKLEVAVIQPENYEDAGEIADQLKKKKAVVINLEFLDKDNAVKVLDFISGVVYALDGNIQKVSGGIFLIAPYNVSITSDVKDELKKGIFPWSL